VLTCLIPVSIPLLEGLSYGSNISFSSIIGDFSKSLEFLGNGKQSMLLESIKSFTASGEFLDLLELSPSSIIYIFGC